MPLRYWIGYFTSRHGIINRGLCDARPGSLLARARRKDRTCQRSIDFSSSCKSFAPTYLPPAAPRVRPYRVVKAQTENRLPADKLHKLSHLLF